MTDERRCRWCHHQLSPCGAPAPSDELRAAHCDHRECSWCRLCVTRREAAARAGLLDVPPETEAEQTREIPAVQDDTPPDQ